MKMTRPQLVKAINSYPGPTMHDRVSRELMEEILEGRKAKNKPTTRMNKLYDLLTGK